MNRLKGSLIQSSKKSREDYRNLMSYPSNTRVPYGMASVPAVGGVPGMAGVAGITGLPAGMTAVPAVGGVARVPNGMSSVYATDKPTAGLYHAGTPTYQGLVQPTYLQQANAATGQAGYYAAQQPSYLSASSPTTQQRYMMSPHVAYSAAGGTLSPQGYALSAGGSYTALAGQPSTLTQTVPVATSTMSSQTQAQYPTYLGSQLSTVQISPSQSPYAAAAATGHPLYPSSPYAGLQMQTAQMQSGQVQTQIPGRVGSAYSTTGLPLGYPGTPSSMDSVRASFYPPY